MSKTSKNVVISGSYFLNCALYDNGILHKYNLESRTNAIIIIYTHKNLFCVLLKKLMCWDIILIAFKCASVRFDCILHTIVVIILLLTFKCFLCGKGIAVQFSVKANINCVEKESCACFALTLY
jgi:hypothetical protein